MRLLDMVKQATEEVGHKPFKCEGKDKCLERQFYSVKTTYCCEELPYVHRSKTNDRIVIETLCTIKVMEYWKK